jgi:ABC-type proline/glycine betaine transport system permease subunit
VKSAAEKRARLGLALIAIGVLTIVAGVLYVLQSADPSARSFEERMSYDQTKVEVHRTLPVGMAVALAGLGLALLGGRLRRGAASER